MTNLFPSGLHGNLHRLPAATDERRVSDVIRAERREFCGVGDSVDAVMRIGSLVRHRGYSPWNDRLCVSPAVVESFDTVCLSVSTVAHPCRRADEWLACWMCGDELACGGCECGGRS